MDAAATADDNGAEMLFILEKNEVTRLYDDWSCSSSSEKGLKDVRIGGSSVILPPFKFDFEELVMEPNCGDCGLGDSILIRSGAL